MSHNIGLDLVRATEAAALASGRWMGGGEKDSVRAVALRAMASALSEIGISATVVIGEEGDGDTLLRVGDRVGRLAGEPGSGAETGSGVLSLPAGLSELDLALDPIDGTTLVAKGLPNAISIVVAAPAGTLVQPEHVAYMEKMAVGPSARGALDISDSVESNLRRIAFAKNMRVQDLTVVMLDRPRHQPLASEIRRAGARIMMISDGDVTAALMVGLDWSGVDALMGIGGAAESVMAASALKCLGGELQCRFWPRSEEERRLAAEAGVGVDRVFGIDDFVTSDDVAFVATGITPGVVLGGVTYQDHWAQTESLIVRSRSGTLRRLQTRHHFSLAPGAAQEQ